MQETQTEIIGITIATMVGILFIILISLVFYRIWYNKNYTDEKGWKKCHDCKKADELMYYTDTWLGREYRCYKC